METTHETTATIDLESSKKLIHTIIIMFSSRIVTLLVSNASDYNFVTNCCMHC